MPEQKYTGLRNKSKRNGRTNMELDDFKKKDKKNMDFTKVDDNSTSDSIDDMIYLFKSHENNQRKKGLNIILFILSLATIYISIISSQNGIAQLGYFILCMSLFVAVLFLFLRYRPPPTTTLFPYTTLFR